MTVPLKRSYTVNADLWDFATDTWNGLTQEEIENAGGNLLKAIVTLKQQIADLRVQNRDLNTIICSEPVWRALKNAQSQLAMPPGAPAMTPEELRQFEWEALKKDVLKQWDDLAKKQGWSKTMGAQVGPSTALPPPTPVPEIHNSTRMEFLSREQIRLECLKLVVRLDEKWGSAVVRTCPGTLTYEADQFFDWVVTGGVLKP